MNYTDKQIEQAFDALPEAIQNALFSSDTERSVQKIGLDAGLLIDQLKTLNGATNFVIMGLLSEKDLSTEIKDSFRISDIQAKEIAEKISTNILKPIDELKAKALAEQKAEKEEEVLEKLEEEAEARFGVAPDDMQMEEREPSIPNMALRTEDRTPNEEVHPFEEKMKKVFTGASANIGDLAIETPAPQIPSAPPARLNHDPYREAIE